MNWINKNRELRQFGLAVGIALGLLGGLFLLREKYYYPYFLSLSIIFLLLGLVRPNLLKPIQKIWMTLAIIIAWLLTRVILTILFYLVITPIGISARVFGKHFLATRFDRATNSYWIPKEPVEFDKSYYENQF